MIDWPVVNQTSPQLVDISHRMLIGLLLQHCQDSLNHRTKVWDTRNSLVGWVGCYDEVRHNACTARGRAALLKLAGPLAASHLVNNMKYARDRKFIEVYVYQKLSKQSLDWQIAMLINRCSFVDSCTSCHVGFRLVPKSVTLNDVQRLCCIMSRNSVRLGDN